MVPPSQALLHFDHPDHFDITQSTGHLNWPHFLFRASSRHFTPNSLGRTTITRVSVCQPPHPYGFFLSGHSSSHGTEQSPGTKGVTSQSTIFSGGDTLLKIITCARTTKYEQKSWKKIHSMRRLQWDMKTLYSCSTVLRSSSFSAISSRSALRLVVASFSSMINLALEVLRTSSCWFTFSFRMVNSNRFLSISAWSSSTRSLNFPHMRDMLSWRSPQSGGSVGHFTDPTVMSNLLTTGSFGTGGVGIPCVVVVVVASTFLTATPSELRTLGTWAFGAAPSASMSSSSSSSSWFDFAACWSRAAPSFARSMSICPRT